MWSHLITYWNLRCFIISSANIWGFWFCSHCLFFLFNYGSFIFFFMCADFFFFICIFLSLGLIYEFPLRKIYLKRNKKPSNQYSILFIVSLNGICLTNKIPVIVKCFFLLLLVFSLVAVVSSNGTFLARIFSLHHNQW